MFGNDLVRFGPVRFGTKNSGSVRFGKFCRTTGSVRFGGSAEPVVR